MKRTSKKSESLSGNAPTRATLYWLGKTKLGKVTLAGRANKYTWEAAGRAGAAADLEKAKKAVEIAVMMADKQMDLFR